MRNGDERSARDLYQSAAEAELAALLALEPRSKPRTFGITAVSVAALLLKSDMLEAARDFARAYGAHEAIPSFAAKQLAKTHGAASSREAKPTTPEIGCLIRAALEKGRLLTSESSPARSDEDQISDEQIIDQLKARSEDGVRLLLEIHGSRAKSLLIGKFGEKHEGTIDESISDAALTIWFKANEFDPNRGSLGGWFFSCARNSLLTTLRAERIRPLLQNLELEELLNVPAKADVRRSKGLRRLLEQLEAAITRLSDMQRDIILTDLAESGFVDNAALASKWETSTNSIHVSRNKSHKRLARLLGRSRKR